MTRARHRITPPQFGRLTVNERAFEGDSPRVPRLERNDARASTGARLAMVKS
jgi:hypothetical protein